jgi:hypothetical protein
MEAWSLDPSQIFRQAALDHLGSPERLDALLGLPNPRLWMLLGGAAMLALALVLWWLLLNGWSFRAFFST